MTTSVAAPVPPGRYAAQWKKIDALLAKHQTATAAPLVDAIYRQARQAHDTPAYVRALLYKIRLLESKEEDADEKAIALLEHDVKTATFPARPILHSLLGGLYANYLAANRSRLYQRTAGADPTRDSTAAADGGSTLATWDVGRLGATIVRHYYLSVEEEPQRQLKISLAQLGDLVAGGDAEGRALRPSLYDLLAHRAVEGLQNQELYITRPEQQFQLTEPKVFGTAQEFAALHLLAPDADSLNGQLHALHLLQRLTASRLQQSPQNLAALADVDLSRIAYLHDLTASGTLDEHYQPALARLAQTYAALPISTEFMAREVELLNNRNPAEAAKLAREAEARFPNSRGARRARSLRQQLEQPTLQFRCADIVVPGQPWRLTLTVKNVPQLHAWAYRITLAEWQSFYNGDERRDLILAQRYAHVLKARPAAAWEVPVPASARQYELQTLIGTGAALPAGYYLLIVSSQAQQPTTQQPGGVTSYAVLGVSELSALNQHNPLTGNTELLALQRQSGTPLVGIRTQCTFARYVPLTRKQLIRKSEVLQTNASGEVTLPRAAEETDQQPERLIATKLWRGADTLLLRDLSTDYSFYTPAEPQPQRNTFLFSDRAIYRPGQTLYFKGILTESVGAKSRLLGGQPISVRLVDVNGQTVQTLPFTTSDFGSFQGSLVLPTGLLNGEMSLQTDDGSLSFAVEDYKRPTFDVAFEPATGLPELGKPVSVRGRALAYAGQPIDGATVSFRVTRRELWPLFGYGRGGFVPQGGGEREIAHDTVATDAQGYFTITFTPPLGEPAKQQRWLPGYLFGITADVTDAAGETHTGSQQVSIGHQPISLSLEGPDHADKQHLPAWRLLSSNAAGEPTPTAGTLRILARPLKADPPGLPPSPEEAAEDEPRQVKALPFNTKNGAKLDLQAALTALPTGRYRLEALGPDSARAVLDFFLFDSQAATVPFATPDWFMALQDSVALGQPAAVLLGSQHAGTHVLLEVESNGQILRKEWLTLDANEQRRISIAPNPAGGTAPLVVHTIQVRDNRLYRHDATIQVAEKPQPLRLDISTFRDKLLPGQRETWRITVHQANGKAANAELLATLYDQSLDAFRSHSFAPLAFGGQDYPTLYSWNGTFGQLGSYYLFMNRPTNGPADVRYPYFLDVYGEMLPLGRRYETSMLSDDEKSAGFSPEEDGNDSWGAPGATATRAVRAAAMPAPARIANPKQGLPPSQPEPAKPTETVPDLAAIVARKDFRETAFWQPALRTDADGNIVLEFQMPEAVTRWQLLALAHDKSLHTGLLARQLLTQKQIQVTPNAPRFFRQGDQFTFTAKVSNLTDSPSSGRAQLFLLDAATGQDITNQLLKGPARQAVAVAARQSTALGWEVALPADFGPTAVTYRVVAQTSSAKEPGGKKRKSRTPPATFSDGEENTLPVLPNRLLLTESLPLPIVGPATREFELTKLSRTSSPTRRNYSLTLEMTANPAWYAVQSLPYLTEYPYECSEQVFSRLYANLMAAHILRSNPRFQTVLKEWQRQARDGTAAQKNALESKLAQNQELKNLLLQETPWVRDAQSETERLARLTELFDQPRLAAETASALAKLQKMQQPDGAFPWFEQMPGDRYITQLIVAGFGKLRQLGVFDAATDRVAEPVLGQALRYLDLQLAEDYSTLRQQNGMKLKDDHLSTLAIQALYARSFWPTDVFGLAGLEKEAHTYYCQQAAAYWPGQTRYLQAEMALALYRDNKAAPAAQEIMRGLSENALHSPELGMYWKEVRGGYYWPEAPAETQATIIEAYHEVKNDQQSVDELKLWLLKQKQTHSWASTRATADACYALLLCGSDWLAPSQPLQVTVGSQTIKPEATQAGTGYYKVSWPAAEVRPAQGKVILTKPDAGVAWGALYWQYFEDFDKVTATTTANPLSLERELYRETRTASGPVLEKLTATSPLKVGDALVVRLVLRTDRSLEYVHLKDQRAAGLEPLSQTSGYRYQNGLGYYESPRDAATNFFLGAVPRGTHVFEYRLRASQAGSFSGGLSQVQCLYAPEFGTHSAGLRLRIAP
ncbi:alpha-2-macroglobulin family protein [Hymenobacter rubidus]|uniref:alpha-2-macroglobulin family protein n=1 Tax=Hymenobacter rubidus TaxID=1441626 RepID=UPI001920313A|nr:MG2 domain-containing protein [Hymenobacter rubidus]